MKDLEAQNVTFSGHITRSSWWSQWLPLVIPVVLFMLIIGYGNRKLAQKPGPLTFGRSQAKIHDQSSEITVRFKDVAGVDEAKAELVEVVDFLRFPFMSEERNYSDKTSEAIDEEVRRISDGLYLRARTILTSRRAELERIARELILKETLDRAQIELLLLAPLIETPA